MSYACLRCSRPLCSSQNTGGTLSNPCLPCQQKCCIGGSPGTKVQDRDHQHSKVPMIVAVQRLGSPIRNMPGPSGPNSVQKTRHPRSKRSVRHHHWHRCTCLTINSSWSQCQCSTHERHQRRADQKGQGFSVMTYEVCSPCIQEASSSAP
jgi:hypothetical protein